MKVKVTGEPISTRSREPVKQVRRKTQPHSRYVMTTTVSPDQQDIYMEYCNNA